MTKINFLLLSFIAVLFSCSKEDETTIETNAKETLALEMQTLAIDFFTTAEAYGLEADYDLGIVIENTEALAYFAGDQTKGEVTLPIWEELDSDVKALFNSWAEGSTFSGEEFFKLNFNWFLPIHEFV